MSLGSRPSDDRLPHLVRQLLLQVGARLVGGDHDHARAAQSSHLTVEPLGDFAEVIVDELLDVALVSGLRPPALVMAAGLLLEVFLQFLEAAGPQPVEISALATDEGDDRALAAPHERDEGGEVEGAADADRVRHRLAQRQVMPHVVEPCREDGESAGPVAGELLLEEAADPLDVLAQPLPLLVGQVGPSRRVRALDLVDESVDATRGVARSRRDAGIEVEIEADRAALFSP